MRCGGAWREGRMIATASITRTIQIYTGKQKNSIDAV